MALKVFKPITPGTRGRVDLRRDDLTADKPEKKLTSGKVSRGGRGAGGRISVRHQGGGHKQKYRIIDFKRNKHGIPGTVHSIEYDPNRSANIALIYYADGDKRYIIAPKGLTVGMKIMAGENAAPTVGNALPLWTNKLLQSNEANDSIYYDKYNKVNAEKLALENQIAKLELEAYAKDRELEKRNITIKNLQSELQNK